MKMLKKLLAIVLTGAMALTLLTACGSNAVTEKDIADVMSDMAKAEGTNVTFTPRAKEREMAQKLAALLESHSENDSDSAELSAKIQGILGIDEGGVNEKSRYVWVQNALTDKLGAEGQAFQVMESLTDKGGAYNFSSLGSKEPADTRYMGTALCKIPDQKDNLVTVRVIVVTAKAEDE